MASPLPPSISRQTQRDGARLICGRNLRVRLEVLRLGVVLVSAHGEVLDADDVAAEERILRELDGELARAGELTVFADLRESPRMAAASRARITLWARPRPHRVIRAHVLVRTALLNMAMSLIAMTIGSDRLEVHLRAPAFLALVRQAAPALAVLPDAPAPPNIDSPSRR